MLGQSFGELKSTASLVPILVAVMCGCGYCKCYGNACGCFYGALVMATVVALWKLFAAPINKEKAKKHLIIVLSAQPCHFTGQTVA